MMKNKVKNSIVSAVCSIGANIDSSPSIWSMCQPKAPKQKLNK